VSRDANKKKQYLFSKRNKTPTEREREREREKVTDSNLSSQCGSEGHKYR